MSNFNNDTIRVVWNSSNMWQQDLAGAWMNFNDYGKTTQFGWEIDHKYPASKGGTDALTNLQPLHWENNRAKGDSYPVFNTTVTSSGSTNTKVNLQHRI